MTPSAAPEDVGLCSERLQRIVTWMQRYLDTGKLPGMLTLVARHGEVVFLEVAGQRDLENEIAVDVDTLFRFYSMTKPVTSVALMMLYEQGLIQLDDPVAHYLPEFGNMTVYVAAEGGRITTEPARQPITVQQLLTHTSGLTYGFLGDSPIAELYKKHAADFRPDDGPLDEVVKRLSGLPLAFQPGTRWHYGVSTDVVGRLVEVVAGQTLDRFFSRHIFEPLGMVDTGFRVPPAQVSRFAALYGWSADDGLALLQPSAPNPYTLPVSTLSGGGGLVSTVSDYFRFTEMMRRKGEYRGVRLLGRKTVEYMTCNHLPGDLAGMGQPSFNETNFEGVGFGLGFAVVLDPARSRVICSPGEYAWGGAASTAFWIDPDEDITVIFLTQLFPSSTFPLRRELRALTYQALID